MRILVAVLAWAMPVVAWICNSGRFGPTNGQTSDQYPTLIVAAGYAFTIWGPIFLLDVVFGTWQVFAKDDARLARARPWVALGLLMTSLWMVAFLLQWFWLALAIIWLSLAGTLAAAILLSAGPRQEPARWWQWLPLSLHAGWVSLAVFLNVAQVIVAFGLLPTTHMLPWTLLLFVLAAALLLAALARMRGNPWYALAAVWGLVGVGVKQQQSALDGATVASAVALTLAIVVAAQSLWLSLRPRRSAT